jgi:hypothetical protein
MVYKDEILTRFVSLFEEDGGAEPFVGPLWCRYETPSNQLLPIFSKIKLKFPVLYEELLLNFRWYGADVGVIRLLRNPPGPDFNGLETEMFRDEGIYRLCIEHGFIQFGRGPDLCYDPVCFDTNNSKDFNQYPIVQLDHEAILCNYKLKIAVRLADSFEHLVRKIIAEK